MIIFCSELSITSTSEVIDMFVTEKEIEILKNSPLLVQRSEPNSYLLYKFVGNGKDLPETFNIKIYTGKRGLSVVTNDEVTYQKLLNGETLAPLNEHVIYIDDSGIGCPIGGVFCGVAYNDDIAYDEVPVEYFQGESFEHRYYLDRYAKIGTDLLFSMLEKHSLYMKDVTVVICIGFVNTKLKDALRNAGFDVRVGEIKGVLQDGLEQISKTVLNERYGFNLYYDPKETSPTTGFQKVIDWINENPGERLKFAKTGWDYFKKIEKPRPRNEGGTAID